MLLYTVLFVFSLYLPAHAESHYRFQIFNSCDVPIQPVFEPPLPQHASAWPLIQPQKSHARKFHSDTYFGSFYAVQAAGDGDEDSNSPHGHPHGNPHRGPHGNPHGENSSAVVATRGEFDVATGQYNINLDHGFNYPLYFTLEGRQYNGECTAAQCSSSTCTDAYRTSSGILAEEGRSGTDTRVPNHICPPDFTTWYAYFC